MNEKQAQELKGHLKEASETIEALVKEAAKKDERIAEVAKENENLVGKNASLSDEVAKLNKHIEAIKVAEQLIDHEIIDPSRKNYWIGEILKSADAPEKFGEKIKSIKKANSSGEEIVENQEEEEKEKASVPEEDVEKKVARMIIDKKRNR